MLDHVSLPVVGRKGIIGVRGGGRVPEEVRRVLDLEKKVEGARMGNEHPVRGKGLNGRHIQNKQGLAAVTVGTFRVAVFSFVSGEGEDPFNLLSNNPVVRLPESLVRAHETFLSHAYKDDGASFQAYKKEMERYCDQLGGDNAFLNQPQRKL